MEKEEIYKKILEMFEKKISYEDHRIQPTTFNANGGSNMAKIEKIVNSVGDVLDIKNIANKSFERIAKNKH